MSVKQDRVVRAIQLIVEDHIANGGDIKYDGRNIAALLYELRSVYSGFASENALIQKHNSGTKWCSDHIWPRQLAGELLLRKFITIGSIDMPDFINDLTVYTTVHYVTRAENNKLRKFQKPEGFTSPENSYARAGIKLLQWPIKTTISTLAQVHPHLKFKLKTKRAEDYD